MLKKTNTDTDIKGRKHQTYQHSENNALSRRLNKFRREKAALMFVLPHGTKFPCMGNTDKCRLSTKMNSGWILRDSEQDFAIITQKMKNNKSTVILRTYINTLPRRDTTEDKK